MYRIVYIAIFAFAASSDGEDIQMCEHFLNPGILRCCGKIPMEEGVNNDIMECRKLSMDPTDCTREICFGEKLGFLLPDGKVNKTQYKEVFVRPYGEATDLFEALNDNCIDGDLDAFGNPEFCELVNLRSCMSVQLITKCPRWEDEGDCKGIKKFVEECLKL